MPNLDEIDMQHIMGIANQMFWEDRGRAEQMVNSPHFRHWIISPGSSKLLVHGDFDSGGPPEPLSPFSVLCATMMQAFRMSPGLISLVFFCGRHLTYREDFQGHGGTVMIRSLIAQLLRQMPLSAIPQDQRIFAEIENIENASVSQLCTVFSFLIRMLPPEKTIFVQIDGINLYEREEYLHQMDQVILCLLDLIGAGPIRQGAKVKLLLTSARPTVEVRQVFEDEPDALLHMAHIPRNEQVPRPGEVEGRLIKGLAEGSAQHEAFPSH